MNETSNESKKDTIMKAILKTGAILGALSLLIMAFKPFFGLSEERDKVILNAISQSLSYAHYEQINYNDQFSEKVFNEYLRKLDYFKRFLTKDDVKNLSQYKYNIDDQIRNLDLSFCDMATALIKKRQDEAAGYYREAISGDFDFTIDEYIQTSPDSLDYAASEAELRDYWRKYVKLSVLEKMYDMIKIQEKAIENKDTSYKQKTMDEIKAECVSSVKENFDQWMKRLSKISDRDWTSFFFNSIISACDPHSDYLPPDEKENFDISMSGKFEGIGATLQNKNGQTKVADIIPGSASWRQGELQVGDIIMKVGQGNEQPVDISNMDLDEAVKLIRGKKGSTVKLTVKKIDGTIKVIPIIRDVVIIEETYAKSSVITTQDGTRKIGYLYLPKFYADFNDKAGRFCSKDVKAELLKLQADGVDGIVFDLRNNGGGSLADVVDMSGLFIEKGPIVQVKNKQGMIRQLNDEDPSVVYNGPLVVMVNNYSASASEILAAALQDYDRAVIMGSKSSFGKGTVQSIYDFDRMITGSNSLKPLGVLKLTIQKFYRINGGTTQLKGVIPDIILPDQYSYMEVGEKESQNALPFDLIPKAQYNTCTNAYKKSKVVSASNDRIKSNHVFTQIDENAKRLKKRADDSYYSLNLDKYSANMKKIEKEAEQFSKIGKDKTGIKASFAQSDKKATEGDTVKTQKFTRWFDDLEKDIYLNEAVNVISDMVKH